MRTKADISLSQFAHAALTRFGRRNVIFLLGRGVYSPPHPAHSSTDVDAHALPHRKRRSADRNRWPTCPIEQAEQALRNESGSRGINVPGALGALAMRKEPLRHNQV